MAKKTRVFIDLDGTAAEWKASAQYEDLYEEGYFKDLRPNAAVVEAARMLARNPDFEVFVLSAYLYDSRYAKSDKNAWVEREMPEIKRENRLFVPSSSEKFMFVPGGIRPTDVLLDDYTKNLVPWNDLAVGVKCLNGINNTNGTWKGATVHILDSPELICEEIMRAIQDKEAEGDAN